MSAIMDAFKVYVPSNASKQHYPQNNASNFQVSLNNPIQLDGQWEVGVESVYYNSNIGDENEQAQVIIQSRVEEESDINDSFPFKFKTSADNTWLGYHGVKPVSIPSDPKNLKEVLSTLNSLNKQMLVDEKQKVFEFRLNADDQVEYEGFSNGITIQMTGTMSKLLGFGWHYKMIGANRIIHDHPKVYPTTLTKDDFRIWYCEPSLVKRQERIIIKDYNEVIGNFEDFKNVFNLRVQPHHYMKMTLKQNKVVLESGKNQTWVFSPNFAKYIHHSNVIGKGTFWANHALYLHQKGYADQSKHQWYIDIYTDEMARMTFPRYFVDKHEFYVRAFNDIKGVFRHLNTAIVRTIKKRIKKHSEKQYDKDLYSFKLSFENNYTKLRIGRLVNIEISRNLMFMLGFDKNHFDEGEHLSNNLPATIDKQEQRLFILSDIGQPISYGTQKENILQEFLHDFEQDYGIVEKRFEPMAYVPVARNYFDTLRFKITNMLFDPIDMIDSKTILVLVFRKVK